MAGAVLSAPDHQVQMRLARLSRVPHPQLHQRLRLTHVLAMQVQRVGRHAPGCIVLAQAQRRRRRIGLLRRRFVPVAALAVLVRPRPLAALVRLSRLRRPVLVLALLGAREGAQPVVFARRGGRGAVVEGCGGGGLGRWCVRGEGGVAHAPCPPRRVSVWADMLGRVEGGHGGWSGSSWSSPLEAQ